MDVLIAGGGLAGLACAKTLVDSGHGVTLIEARPYLGGRASTHRDEDGDWIEEGLHVVLGADTELRALVEEIGQSSREMFAWSTELRLRDTVGPARADFGIDLLRAPSATLAGLFGQDEYLGRFDKLGLLPLGLPSLRSVEELRRDYDLETVAGWWARASGNPVLLERVLRPACRALQLGEPEDASAFSLLGAVHQIAKHATDSHLGCYRGPREETIFGPLGRYLSDRGARLRTGTRVTGIKHRASSAQARVECFEVDGERVTADAFVVAVPVWDLLELLAEPLSGMDFFRRLHELPMAPAISVQLWFDRRVVEGDAFTLVANSHVALYHDASRTTYPDARGSALSAIVAPAEALLCEDDAVIVDRVVSDLARVEPEVRRDRVRKAVVSKHQRHVIRPRPGVLSRRPSNLTPLENLFVAGDWTDQPAFDSQEGAVRSGRACAREVLKLRSRS